MAFSLLFSDRSCDRNRQRDLPGGQNDQICTICYQIIYKFYQIWSQNSLNLVTLTLKVVRQIRNAVVICVDIDETENNETVNRIR